MKDDKINLKLEPPTPEQEFDMFCYEMFLKNKDEREIWEKTSVHPSPVTYIKKNRSFLEKEFKRMRKKGNL